MKFVRAGATNGAGIRLHGTEFQAQARENVAVGLVHTVVGFLQRFLIEVEGIRILHQKLAATHQAKTRTNFVAEFSLNLVKIKRQLFVAVQLIAR